MNTFTVGFSKPNTWKPLAELIMFVGRTKYSHTFNTWKCKELQRRKVFEAIGSGLRIISNKIFKAHATIVELYHFDSVSDEDLLKMERLAHDMAGTEYGFKALIGLGISKLFNCINKKLRIKGKQGNLFKDGIKSNICIEASARQLCEILKIELPSDIENYDLKMYNAFIKRHGRAETQEKLDRINGNI